MNPSNRVLVTGATGFIGRQSLAPLMERGYEVHALCTKEPVESDRSVLWHTADLLEEGAAAGLCTEIRATHLLHFAWYVDPKDYKTSPQNKRWVEATRSLVRAFRESGGTRAVLAGTCMEYDWSIPQEILVEDISPLKPATPYGAAKNETRIQCERYAKESGLSFAWGRVFFLYGPYEAPARLVPQVMRALEDGKMPPIVAGGLIRDYSYVLDTAGAFAALVDSDALGAVNIASGNTVTLKDVGIAAAEIVGKPDLAQPIPEVIPEGEPARIVADVSRLRTEAGWTPRFSLRQGLEETIEWWKKAK